MGIKEMLCWQNCGRAQRATQRESPTCGLRAQRATLCEVRAWLDEVIRPTFVAWPGKDCGFADWEP
jgi:hypothetical protein